MSRISNISQRITPYFKMYNDNFDIISGGCILVGGITGTGVGAYIACDVFENGYRRNNGDQYIAPILVPGYAYLGGIIGIITPYIVPPILAGLIIAGPCMLVKKYKIDKEINNSKIT